ncbi:unnamed protein product [Echinostoma caproni]|uniref:Secreted protein n=1 Tax=Echinostoma caproni TaxID=27848 RepID=A0A183B5D9_9TREM|nr:unnamed protein product [Echinostoma caproni]
MCRLIRSTGALFALGCKVLRCPAVCDTTLVKRSEQSDLLNDDAIQPESTAGLCLRIFQRSTQLLESGGLNMDPSVNSLSPRSTTVESSLVDGKSSDCNQLNNLTNQIISSIQAMQPNL